MTVIPDGAADPGPRRAAQGEAPGPGQSPAGVPGRQDGEQRQALIPALIPLPKNGRILHSILLMERARDRRRCARGLWSRRESGWANTSRVRGALRREPRRPWARRRKRQQRCSSDALEQRLRGASAFVENGLLPRLHPGEGPALRPSPPHAPSAEIADLRLMRSQRSAACRSLQRIAALTARSSPPPSEAPCPRAPVPAPAA